MKDILSQANTERLQDYLRNIEGLRHGGENYEELEKRAVFIADAFGSFGLPVENQEVLFHGKTYRNIVATLEGMRREDSWLLLGAHYDSAAGSPGADDNASGAACLLESARILTKVKPGRTTQFVAFTLEEPQPQTVHFLIGSALFAQEARRAGRRYEAVLILESVGYTDNAEGSQIVPSFIGMPAPKKGNFLGVIANRRSKALMEAFCASAEEHVPELVLVSYAVPFSGRIVPESRFSDHSSFWNNGYPALMLTDTAMFRNPHYHTAHDRYATLDFSFMQKVTKAVISAMLKL